MVFPGLEPGKTIPRRMRKSTWKCLFGWWWAEAFSWRGGLVQTRWPGQQGLAALQASSLVLRRTDRQDLVQQLGASHLTYQSSTVPYQEDGLFPLLGGLRSLILGFFWQLGAGRSTYKLGTKPCQEGCLFSLLGLAGLIPKEKMLHAHHGFLDYDAHPASPTLCPPFCRQGRCNVRALPETISRHQVGMGPSCWHPHGPMGHCFQGLPWGNKKRHKMPTFPWVRRSQYLSQHGDRWVCKLTRVRTITDLNTRSMPLSTSGSLKTSNPWRPPPPRYNSTSKTGSFLFVFAKWNSISVWNSKWLTTRPPPITVIPPSSSWGLSIILATAASTKCAANSTMPRPSWCWAWIWPIENTFEPCWSPTLATNASNWNVKVGTRMCRVKWTSGEEMASSAREPWSMTRENTSSTSVPCPAISLRSTRTCLQTPKWNSTPNSTVPSLPSWPESTKLMGRARPPSRLRGVLWDDGQKVLCAGVLPRAHPRHSAVHGRTSGKDQRGRSHNLPLLSDALRQLPVTVESDPCGQSTTYSKVVLPPFFGWCCTTMNVIKVILPKILSTSPARIASKWNARPKVCRCPRPSVTERQVRD